MCVDKSERASQVQLPWASYKCEADLKIDGWEGDADTPSMQFGTFRKIETGAANAGTLEYIFHTYHEAVIYRSSNMSRNDWKCQRRHRSGACIRFGAFQPVNSVNQ